MCRPAENRHARCSKVATLLFLNTFHLSLVAVDTKSMQTAAASRLFDKTKNQSQIFLQTVDDASGHYTTGFYWGNNYWTGSRTLCRSIYRHDDDFFQEKKASANTGLTFNRDQERQAAQLVHVNPPFFPRFGVVKVGLRESTLVPSVSEDFCRISTEPIVDHIIHIHIYFSLVRSSSVCACRRLATKKTFS